MVWYTRLLVISHVLSIVFILFLSESPYFNMTNDELSSFMSVPCFFLLCDELSFLLSFISLELHSLENLLIFVHHNLINIFTSPKSHALDFCLSCPSEHRRKIKFHKVIWIRISQDSQIPSMWWNEDTGQDLTDYIYTPDRKKFIDKTFILQKTIWSEIEFKFVDSRGEKYSPIDVWKIAKNYAKNRVCWLNKFLR